MRSPKSPVRHRLFTPMVATPLLNEVLEPRMLLADAVEHIGHVPGHNELRIGEGVHQEHALLTFSIVEGHAYVEHRGLHDVLPEPPIRTWGHGQFADHCR